MKPGAGGQFHSICRDRGGRILIFRAKRLNIGFGMLQPVAGDVQFDDNAVMHQAIDRGRCGHRILKDALPFGEWQVAGEQNTASLLALCQQSKDDFHFFARLPDVPEIINDHAFVAGVFLD